MKGVLKMTCTCELIFGKADMNDSGILFNHRLSLYENFRPVLVMERKPGPTDGGALIDRWIPHIDRMLEDSMVMLAAYGAGDENVLALVSEMKQGNEDKDIFDLHTVNEELMAELYEASKKVFRLQVFRTKNSRSSDRWKVMACLFKDTTMARQVERFLNYDIDIEVCRSVYRNEYSAWSQEINIWGELK